MRRVISFFVVNFALTRTLWSLASRHRAPLGIGAVSAGDPPAVAV
jgi:hypothetical protein